MTENTNSQNYRLIYGVAFSFALGVIAGLPFIYGKNGYGPVVVLGVVIISSLVISLALKGQPAGKPNRDYAVSIRSGCGCFAWPSRLY